MGWSGHGLVPAPASLPRKIFKQKEETTFMREYNIKRGKKPNKIERAEREESHKTHTKDKTKKNNKNNNNIWRLFFSDKAIMLCVVGVVQNIYSTHIALAFSSRMRLAFICIFSFLRFLSLLLLFLFIYIYTTVFSSFFFILYIMWAECVSPSAYTTGTRAG